MEFYSFLFKYNLFTLAVSEREKNVYLKSRLNIGFNTVSFTFISFLRIKVMFVYKYEILFSWDFILFVNYA